MFSQNRKQLVPRNGRMLIVGIVARISGCADQTELSLDDQVDHAKQIFEGDVQRSGRVSDNPDHGQRRAAAASPVRRGTALGRCCRRQQERPSLRGSFLRRTWVRPKSRALARLVGIEDIS